MTDAPRDRRPRPRSGETGQTPEELHDEVAAVVPLDALDLLRTVSVFGRPADAAKLAVQALCGWGALGAAVYLVDYGHETMVALATAGEPSHQDGPEGPRAMEGTMVGHCFTADEPVELVGSGVTQRWVPVGVRANRVGVLEVLHRPGDAGLAATANDVAMALGFALADAGRYTDRFHDVRRSRPMELSAEIQWSLLPPQDFAVEEASVSAQLEPAYDGGGDAYDYTLNGDTLFVAILDGMGHGVEASLLATAALNTYRHGRRTGEKLVDLRKRMDRVVGSFFRTNVFVTGVLGELDIRTGRFRWINAGHPPPLLLRGRRVVAALESPPTVPFGLGPEATEDGEVQLEPGDAVEEGEAQLEPGDAIFLHTDGVVDARSERTGDPFGEEGLRDFLERELAAGQLNGETLRRLTSSLSTLAAGSLGDDATVLLTRWHGPRHGRPGGGWAGRR